MYQNQGVMIPHILPQFLPDLGSLQGLILLLFMQVESWHLNMGLPSHSYGPLHEPQLLLGISSMAPFLHITPCLSVPIPSVPQGVSAETFQPHHFRATLHSLSIVWKEYYLKVFIHLNCIVS